MQNTHKGSSLKRLVLGALSAVAIGTPALAGEITGNGKPIEVHGKSICAFSGQNDGNPPFGRTQSFGQNVKHDLNDPRAMDPDFEGPFLPHPGWACNPKEFESPE